jgi:hypothetical protein
MVSDGKKHALDSFKLVVRDEMNHGLSLPSLFLSGVSQFGVTKLRASSC